MRVQHQAKRRIRSSAFLCLFEREIQLQPKNGAYKTNPTMVASLPVSNTLTSEDINSFMVYPGSRGNFLRSSFDRFAAALLLRICCRHVHVSMHDLEFYTCNANSLFYVLSEIHVTS